MRKKLMSLTCVLSVLLMGFLWFAISQTHATDVTTPSGWANSELELTSIKGLTAEQYSDYSSGCSWMVIPVVKLVLGKSIRTSENHCMVSTSQGLIGADVAVFQPRGFDQAFEIHVQTGGNKVPVPILSSASAFLINGDSSYPGINVGLYKELINHLKFNNNPIDPAFNLDEPDQYFKYPSGRYMAYVSGGAFSSDGNYWIAEGINYGFVRTNLLTLESTTFAANSPTTTSHQPLGTEMAISPTGRYAALAYNAPQGWGNKYFKIVDINTCGTEQAGYSATTSTCQETNVWPKALQGITGVRAITHLRFASDNSLYFVAIAGNGANTSYTQYALAPNGQPTRLETYLGMGDSFASGEGAFNYVDGTDLDPNKCHQSAYSYPYLLHSIVGSSASVACSGAVIRNIIGDNNKDKNNQLKGVSDREINPVTLKLAESNHLPGVGKQVDYIYLDNPQIVTLSIGGNDVGFSDIIKRCVLPYNNFSQNSQTCYQSYEDRKELVDLINRQVTKLVNVYTQITKSDPTRRVYIIGYPQAISPGGYCAGNVRMNSAETTFAYQLTEYLDKVIQVAAARAGVFYVDTQHAFDGHRLCEEGTKAVNGLTAGNDALFVLGQESFHPNVLGHELFTSTIKEETNDLTAPMPTPQELSLPDDSELLFLNAPKANRPLNYAVNNPGTFNIKAGKSNINVSDFSQQILPSSDFEAVLHSDPVNVGTLHVDQHGIITGEIDVPAGVEPGIHTLHLYGKNMFGEPMDIQTTVYLEAADDDFDGDGIKNIADSCPGVPQTWQDVDADGTDDGCDPEIGPAPTRPDTQGDSNGSTSQNPSNDSNEGDGEADDKPTGSASGTGSDNGPGNSNTENVKADASGNQGNDKLAEGVNPQENKPVPIQPMATIELNSIKASEPISIINVDTTAGGVVKAAVDERSIAGKPAQTIDGFATSDANTRKYKLINSKVFVLAGVLVLATTAGGYVFRARMAKKH